MNFASTKYTNVYKIQLIKKVVLANEDRNLGVSYISYINKICHTYIYIFFFFIHIFPLIDMYVSLLEEYSYSLNWLKFFKFKFITI